MSDSRHPPSLWPPYVDAWLVPAQSIYMLSASSQSRLNNSPPTPPLPFFLFLFIRGIMLSSCPALFGCQSRCVFVFFSPPAFACGFVEGMKYMYASCTYFGSSLSAKPPRCMIHRAASDCGVDLCPRVFFFPRCLQNKTHSAVCGASCPRARGYF